MTQPESLLSERRNHRQIQLDSDEPAPVGKFYDKQVRDTKNGPIIVERYHDGDYMVIKTSKDLRIAGPHGEETHTSNRISHIPIHINFEWIKKQADIENDEDCGMPWTDGDGWEHTVEARRDFRGTEEAFSKTRGYISYDCVGYFARVIVNPTSFGWESEADRLAYFRAKGASKQVARECVAFQHRAYVDQIVSWYVDGYHCSFIKIEFELGGKTYEESCGGIEDDYVDKGALDELAGNIAHALERDGFIVTGEPVWDIKASKLAAYHKRLTDGPTLFDWRD